MNRTVFFSGVRKSLFRGRLSQSQVDGMNDLFEAWNRWGDGNIRHLAYVFATDYHETGARMQPVREGFAKSDREARRIVRNRPYGKPIDGKVYYGRGDVQITWRENYAKVGNLLGLPLVDKPDLALDPKVSKQIIVRGLLEGWFTGKKLGDFKGFKHMRRVVNGMDKAALIAGYAEAFHEALAAASKYVETAEPRAETTGKPAHKSTTNLAAGAAALSTVASASRDARTVMENLGVPSWVLMVVVLAALAWIFRERIKKAYLDGV